LQGGGCYHAGALKSVMFMRQSACLPAILLSALACGAAVPAQSPQEVWKAGIADENKDYAAVPHAMLKIQDSAYLGDGQSAVLQGVKGQPGSWHWATGGKGALTVSYKNGKIAVIRDGRAVDTALLTKSIAVDQDVDIEGQPTQVGAGINGWRIFVFNQQNPMAKHFTGVAYYPYDRAFRVTARFAPDPKLPARIFRTSRGTDKQFFHAGDAVFTLHGRSVTLPFYAESNKPDAIKDMSAFYTDDLTGKGAYGAGRYVDAEAFGKFPPATITIDFNNAYNPNCARSAHFTCPVAMDNIQLAMTAGERDPHSLH
jgi:uncharacterized protein (DUF1684 family)